MADDYNDDEAPDDNAAPGDTDATPAIPTPGSEDEQPITSPEDDQALQEQQAYDKEHPLRKFILSLLGQSNQPQQTAQEEYDPNTGLNFGNSAPPSDTQARRGLPRLNPSTGIQLPDVSTPGGTFNPMTGERTPPSSPPSIMPPEVVQAVEHAVNKDGAIEKGEAAMHAAEHATRRAGPEAGKAYIGAKEAEYNAMRAAGAVALDHSNILTTVDAANRAFNALPDGETVNFSQGPNRTVTATVKGFNSQPVATNLSLDQMGKLLRTEFNDVMHNTVAGTIQKLGGSAPGVPPGATLMREENGVNIYNGNQPARQTPQTRQAYDYHQVPSYMKNQGVTQDMWDEAISLFPQGNQNTQRMQYVRKQLDEQAGYSSKLDVAKATGESRENVAKTAAQGRVQAWDVRGQHGENIAKTRGESQERVMDQRMKGQLLQKMEDIAARHQDANTRLRAQVAAIIIRSAPLGLDLNDLNDKLKEHGADIQGLLGGQQENAQAPASAGSQTPAKGGPELVRSKKDGQTYWRYPDGRLVPARAAQ